MTRLILGLFAASLWPLLFFLLGTGYTRTFWAPILLCMSYLGTLFFALPLLFLMRKKRWLAFWQVQLGAWVSAMCLFALYALATNLPHLQLNFWNLFNSFSLCGLISGVLFWVLGVWRNLSKYPASPAQA